ncbi:MAG: alkaline phosphatase [Burkholderiales bacterium]|nr:MAG: alkaline phosphatase [Burkholderiales bacterium]
MLAGASLLPAACATRQAISYASNPFTMGVASGDPDANSVVLWTRLSPDPMAPDFGMPQSAVFVQWEVAEDDRFNRIVRSGEEEAHAGSAFSIHAEVGGLKPGRTYWYRFTSGNAVSPVGRTRTTPARDADVQGFRYVFSACQQYNLGYYGAWRHAVAENPDFVVFLGDYIYERAPRADRDNVRLTVNEDALDLASYRRRYASYKMDEDLKAAHAAAPWLVIWDDHEVANNYGGDFNQQGLSTADFLLRRAAAYQAWYEHMPVRKSSAPVGPNTRIYRSFHWGRAGAVQLIDGRQYRTLTEWPEFGADRNQIPDSDLRRDPKRTMLGLEQEAWLFDQLKRSNAKWNILAQQFAIVERQVPGKKPGQWMYGNDAWDGYPATRERVLQALSGTSNPSVIGGDSHIFMAADLRIKREGALVAPAFVGGSIASPANDVEGLSIAMKHNPDMHFGENKVRGYTLVEAGPKQMTLTMRSMVNARDVKTEQKTLAQFVIEDGKPGATRI